MQYKDYYKILGIEKTSTTAQIKSAYRKLAKKYHPDVDKSTGAQEKFKDINEAYEVLSDPDKKKRYDNLGSDWQAGQSYTPPPGFDGFNFGGGNTGYSQAYSNFGDLGGFSDFFKSIFGDMAFSSAQTRSSRSSYDDESSFFNTDLRQKQTQKPQNIDITQKIYVSAKDLFSQKPINVKINLMKKCTQCKGVGSFCSNCNGTGFVNETKTLNVKIPLGIKEGQKIRLKNEGKVNEYGQKGDLYLNVFFKDLIYKIEGNDLTKTVEISPSQAVIGCKKEIVTLHGKINITIPPLTKTNKTLRLKDLGLPKKPSGFGNLNVKILINLPDKLTEKQIELYKKLSEIKT